MRGSQVNRQGIILVLVAGVMVIIGVLTTAFLTRMRNSAGQADDVVRLAQNRVTLFAAMTFIQERSRLGYGQYGEDLDGDGYTLGIIGDTANPTLFELERDKRDLVAYPREAYGWIDVRAEVPTDAAVSVAHPSGSDFYTPFAEQDVLDEFSDNIITPAPGGAVEHASSRRIGPRAEDGRILWDFQVRRLNSILTIEVTNPGSGYTSQPTVAISAPTNGLGRQATARAIVRDGGIGRIEIIEPGSGYTGVPTITLTGGGGTGATATGGKGGWTSDYRFVASPRSRPNWPAPGSIMRAPFHMMKRPPWAVSIEVAPNEIPSDHTIPTFGVPFLNNVDPLPALADGVSFNPDLPDPTSASRRRNWAEGDQNPVTNSQNLSWFRIYRETGYETGRPEKVGPRGSTFIITVGSGGTQGYRDWAEVQAESATSLFDDSEDLFDQLIANERRHWYRVEWTGGVGGGAEHLYAFPTAIYRSSRPQVESSDRNWSSPEGSWQETLPINASRFVDVGYRGGGSVYTMPNVHQTSAPVPRNYMGTIRYIQRLEPGDAVIINGNW